MEHLLNMVFFLSLFLLLHSYIIYPLSMLVLNLFINKEYKCSENALPEISIIISVFNEEKVIERTIRNFLKSNYDLNKIEFIIGSDNSTDSTNQIIFNLQKEISTIKFFPFNVRRGKSQVLNDLVRHSTADILVFSDANTIYHPDALGNLIKYYADDRIGGVSGKLNLVEFEESKNSGSQEKRYWDFETWLKGKEGKLGKLIGANGGIYSLRKKYFFKIPKEFPIVDDFFLSLKVLEQKKDFLYIKEATADELTAPSLISEFKRKVRGNANIISTIRSLKKLLLPSLGLTAYSLWSHKVIRWFTPVILILVLITNILLFKSGSLYVYILVIQLILYIAGIIGYFLNKTKIRIQLLLIIFYFLLTNLAMLIGIIKFIFGKHTAYWQSTPRI